MFEFKLYNSLYKDLYHHCLTSTTPPPPFGKMEKLFCQWRARLPLLPAPFDMFDTVVEEEEENLDEEEERPELRDAVEIFRSPCTGQPSPGLVFVMFMLVRYRYYQEKWKTKDKTQSLHRTLC